MNNAPSWADVRDEFRRINDPDMRADVAIRFDSSTGREQVSWRIAASLTVDSGHQFGVAAETAAILLDWPEPHPELRWWEWLSFLLEQFPGRCRWSGPAQHVITAEDGTETVVSTSLHGSIARIVGLSEIAAGMLLNKSLSLSGDRNDRESPDAQLTFQEKCIIDAIGGETLFGPQIAEKTAFGYSSRFRAKLSEMVKRGLLEHPPNGRGYCLPT